MNDTIQKLRSIDLREVTLERVCEAIKKRVLDVPDRLAWNIETELTSFNRAKLQAYKDQYRNRRCFVIGNGPSLKNMDLSLLQNEITLGSNRIYLLSNEHPHIPTYLASIDTLLLDQFHQDISRVSIPKFINWKLRKHFRESPDVAFLNINYTPHFGKDITRPLWGGHTVTYVCLQVAFYMGFKEVILIGVDHNYGQQGVPNQDITAAGGDQNHFCPNYYTKGHQWRIPDYKGAELAYSMARREFEKDNRIVLDATINGKLHVFKKVNYESLFKG